MPIDHKEDQTIVHCTGDVLVLPFSPKQEPCKGVAWLLLQERGGGEIGRKPKPSEVDDEMCIQGQPGVLIAADDYRSLDVIIDALKSLRNDLAMIEVDERRKKGSIPRRIEMYQGNENAPMFVSGLDLKTVRSYEVKGRGLVRVCVWPKEVEPFPITGKVVVLDSDLMEVTAIETVGGVKRGEEFGIIAKPFKQEIDDGLQ